MGEGGYGPGFDIEDYPEAGNEEEDKERVAREVFEKNDNDHKAEYYNDWIMKNLGWAHLSCLNVLFGNNIELIKSKH